MDLDGDPLTYLLSYNAATGAAIYEVAEAGSPGMRRLARRVSSVPGWTSIVPMNIHGEGGPDVAYLLSYNATTGLAFYSIGRAPGIQDIVGAAVHAAPGFTAIVPLNINGDALTICSGTTPPRGSAVYTKGAFHQNVYGQDVVAVRDAAPGWTSIVPMRLDGDSVTDLLSYNAATGLAV